MEETNNSTNQNHQPQKYHNRASLAMVTLPGAWVIFDIFAFVMGETTLAIGTSIFTVLLIAFFIFLQIRGKKAEKKRQEQYVKCSDEINEASK